MPQLQRPAAVSGVALLVDQHSGCISRRGRVRPRGCTLHRHPKAVEHSNGSVEDNLEPERWMPKHGITEDTPVCSNPVSLECGMGAKRLDLHSGHTEHPQPLALNCAFHKPPWMSSTTASAEYRSRDPDSRPVSSSWARSLC